MIILISTVMLMSLAHPHWVILLVSLILLTHLLDLTSLPLVLCKLLVAFRLLTTWQSVVTCRSMVTLRLTVTSSRKVTRNSVVALNSPRMRLQIVLLTTVQSWCLRVALQFMRIPTSVKMYSLVPTKALQLAFLVLQVTLLQRAQYLLQLCLLQLVTSLRSIQHLTSTLVDLLLSIAPSLSLQAPQVILILLAP